jgi:hypothetical protein
VRESNALLAAAPVPRDSTACCAFATEAFRRQEANFGSTQRIADTMINAAMSVALKSAVAASPAAEGGGIGVFPQPTAGGAARVKFGAPLLWRVKGVGATPVSVIIVAED